MSTVSQHNEVFRFAVMSTVCFSYFDIGKALHRNTIDCKECPICWRIVFSFNFSIVFWTVVAVQWPSRRLHRRRLFFTHLTVQSRSPPSTTTLDRELVSVLEVIIEPGDVSLFFRKISFYFWFLHYPVSGVVQSRS